MGNSVYPGNSGNGEIMNDQKTDMIVFWIVICLIVVLLLGRFVHWVAVTVANLLYIAKVVHVL